MAVLALMFKSGKENRQLAHAWRQMPTKTDQTAILHRPVDIKALLPKNFNFYRYSGSLTTPPCSEGVSWLVLDKTVDASKEQIKKFHDVMRYDNNRPLQKLNGRVVID